MSAARDRWRAVYRQTRKDAGIAGWVLECFPSGWLAAGARERIRPFRILPRPGHVAPLLLLASNARRRGEKVAAFKYLIEARETAQRHARTLPPAAFGA